MKTLRAHGFNQRPRLEQVVGYLERNEPLLDQPDRKATSFVTSHFYLDDFVQSSKDPNPRPLQHTPLHPEDGFRTPAEATDEYQGYGGTRFVEDDLAGDPEAGALASNGQGPVCAALQTARRRQRGAAAQAFRSQLPQDAADYVRLNVLPRPGQAQPPPQIIGRPSDVERLLDEAGQCAQEIKRGAAQAVEETAAVPAEEGKVAVAAKGVGGGLGTWGAWLKEQQPWRPPWNAGSCNGGAGRWACRRRSLRPGARHGLGAGEHAQGSEDAAVQDVRSANGMNDATQPQHFTLRTGSSTSGSRSPASGQSTAPVPELVGELQFRAVTPEPASAQL